jgi:signal transduction histidine kinase
VSDASAADDRRRLRHDLRSPLTIIVGFAEVLAADKPMTDDARRDYAQRVQAAAEELRAMLDDFFEDDGGSGTS